MAHEDDGREGDGEIDDQWGHDTQDVDYLRDDVFALGGKEYDDREDEANEGEGRDEADEVGLVVLLAEKATEAETGDNSRPKRDAQEDGYGGSDCVIADINFGVGA